MGNIYPSLSVISSDSFLLNENRGSSQVLDKDCEGVFQKLKEKHPSLGEVELFKFVSNPLLKMLDGLKMISSKGGLYHCNSESSQKSVRAEGNLSIDSLNKLERLIDYFVDLRKKKPFAHPNASIPQLCSTMSGSDKELQRCWSSMYITKEWGFTAAFLPYMQTEAFSYDASDEKFRNVMRQYLLLLAPNLDSISMDQIDSFFNNPLFGLEFESGSMEFDLIENVEKAILMQALLETYNRPTQVSQETLMAFDQVVKFFPKAYGIVESILQNKKDYHADLKELEQDIKTGVLIKPSSYPQLHSLALTLFYQQRITASEFSNALLFSTSLKERGENGYQFISMNSDHPLVSAVYDGISDVHHGLSPAKKVLFQMLLNKLPQQEQNVLLLPVTEHEAAFQSDSRGARNITNAICGLGYSSLSIIKGSDGKKYRVVPTLGMMQAFLEAKDGLNSILLTPKINLSTFDEIRSTRLRACHDVAYPFEGVEIPRKLDSREVDYAIDVIFHDLYHGIALGIVPHPDRIYYIQQHDLIKSNLERRGFYLSDKTRSLIVTEVLNRLVDMEFINDYNSIDFLVVDTKFKVKKEKVVNKKVSGAAETLRFETDTIYQCGSAQEKAEKAEEATRSYSEFMQFMSSFE